ncbi:MAG TPA: ATP-binding protein [Rectinemataceae bacterium]
MASVVRDFRKDADSDKSRSVRLLGALHIGILLALSAATLIFARIQFNSILRGTRLLLQSVASQQAKSVEEWRKRHLVEAEETRGDEALEKSASSFLRSGDASARKSLISRFENFRKSYGYERSFLADSDLRVLVSENPSDTALSLATLAGPAFELAKRENRPVLSEIATSESLEAPSIFLAIPLARSRDEIADAHREPVPVDGFLVHILRADSELFPIVDSLPFSDRMVETLLVRVGSENAEILWAHEKGKPEAARPLSDADAGPILETRAANAPSEFVHGRNWLGEFSYAVSAPIRESTWAIVAEISRSELLHDWIPVFVAIGLIPFIGTLALALLGSNRLLRLTGARYKELLDAEKRLRESESKFAAFMDRMPSMAMIKDEDSRIIFANASMGAHYPVESWLGKLPGEIFGEPQASITLDWDRKALETGYVEYEETRTDKNGLVLNLLIQKFAIDLGDGRRYLGQIITDVTERDRSTRQIRQINTTLEAQVRERTAQLQSSTEDFQRFAYAVTHGISSPLRSLLDYAQELERSCAETLEEEDRSRLRGLKRSADTLASTMDRLFEIYRLSTLELRIERENIGLLAESILSERIKAEPGRIVSITTSPSMYADCDARLVAKLFEDLIDNAFEYTRGMPVAKIEIGSNKPGEGAGPSVFYVRDNGAGFDMTNAELILEPFLRADEATGIAVGGPGLALAKRVVERHGGRLWFESEPGTGTTVYFTLSP